MKRKDKEYRELANEIAESANNSFDDVKVEEDEEIQLIVASDIASVVLSNKRAYFNGEYHGASEDKVNGDIVNLDSIKRVRLKKKIYSYQKYVVLLSLGIMFFSIISLITSAKKFFAPNFSDDGSMNIIFSIMIISLIACIASFIYMIASFDAAKYDLLQFVCENKKYGIEIRNMDIYDMVHKIVLVAKQQVSLRQTKDDNVIVKSDKISSLNELSKLYEQGLICLEEFEKLKREIIDKE